MSGDSGGVFDVDWMDLLAREVLRERTPALIAEACAWAVGLSDQPHHLRRNGRVVALGGTLGERAAAGQPLSGEEDLRLDLGDTRPGSFADALGALTGNGTVHADRFDAEVLRPFVRETCLVAAARARADRPRDWAELADDVGEEPDAPEAVVAAGDWEAPLRIVAEHLVLAALGAVPLIEVEAEGLPLSLVRAAEAVTRSAAPPAEPGPDVEESLAGAVFLAEAAVRSAELPLPVPPEQAERLRVVLVDAGLEPDEVVAVLPHLPVDPSTADRLARAGGTGRPGE